MDRQFLWAEIDVRFVTVWSATRCSNLSSSERSVLMTAQLSSSEPRIMDPKPTHGGAPSHSPPDTRYVPGNSLARFLGYFSIGLGLAELLAPRTMSRLTGVRQQGLLQVYGVREIACGIGILASSRPTEWLWARVAGDALDLGALGV